MKINTDALLASVDLVSVIAADLGPANHAGAWRCPFHQDKSPSFGVVKGKRNLWKCFGCGKSGDAIAYLRERHGLSFRQACERLAPVRSLPVERHGSGRVKVPAPAVRQSEPPQATWAIRAAAVAEEAARVLWTPAGRPGVEYLRGRGVADEAALVFGLGWIAEDRYDSPASWGLEDNGKSVWTPSGVSLPWYIDGECWRLNVRRLNPGDGPKYIGPAGFRAGLFNADALTPGRAIALVEGEFDALAIHQAAADLAVPVASGSTCGARVARWLYACAAAPVVLVAFDADAAGDDASGWWLAKLPNARRWRPTGAKDPGAMPLDALRSWVADGLGIQKYPRASDVACFPNDWTTRFTAEQLERLAIRTTDGGMSDAAALAAEGASPGS